jgi:hypothetical protein
MHLKSKSCGGGAVLALLALALVAGIAEARGKDPLAPCKARCERMAKEAQKKLDDCTKACPKPSSRNMDAFQACTQTCAKKHSTEVGGPSCVSRCDEGELDKPKKSHKSTHAEHHEEKATHTRPPISR